LRRSKMSPEQLDERATLLAILTDGGWEPTHDKIAEHFTADRYLVHELEVRLGRHLVCYSAAERALAIRLRPAPGAHPSGTIELNVRGRLPDVARQLVSHGSRLSTEPLAFLAALPSMPDVAVRILRGGEWLPFDGDSVEGLGRPAFEPVTFERVDFSLGEVLDSSFFLAAADLGAAHTRCLEAAADLRAIPVHEGLEAAADLRVIPVHEGLEADAELADLRETRTLAELFALSFVDVTTDTEGNIVGVEQGGDSWVLDHLDAIADLVRAGSYFLIQDDTARCWRVEYTGTGVRYLRQRGSTEATAGGLRGG
jgi:hypothetical protein